MNETVQRAVDDIRAAFPQSTFVVHDDNEGGAWIIVEDLSVGGQYAQSTSWFGFRITFQYPYADVYPHFARPDLNRRDGRPLGEGISGGHTFLGRQALQLSRRSNRLNPQTDTALLKLLKVIQWLTTHP